MRVSAVWHAAMAAGLLVAPGEWRLVVEGLALNHAALATLACLPGAGALGATLHRLPPASAARREVALTFDDGPDASVTPRALDLLDAAGATASFFCIGRRAEARPALVAEIARRGHSVENHTHTHPNLFACLGIAGHQREIGAAQAVLTDAAGAAPRWFRPPMGLASPLLDPALAGSGLGVAGWTRRGFDTVRRDPARVLHSLCRRLAPGDVLLLHDGSCARTEQGNAVTLAILPALLDELARRGLRGVSLPRAFSP